MKIGKAKQVDATEPPAPAPAIRELRDDPQYIEAVEKLTAAQRESALVDARYSAADARRATGLQASSEADADALVDGRELTADPANELALLNRQRTAARIVVARAEQAVAAARDEASRQICDTARPAWAALNRATLVAYAALADAHKAQTKFIADLEMQGATASMLEWAIPYFEVDVSHGSAFWRAVRDAAALGYIERDELATEAPVVSAGHAAAATIANRPAVKNDRPTVNW